jgi:Protein of unknown function (DUF2917)
MAQANLDSELLVRLKQRELLDVNDGQGLAVVCLSGTAWITQSDDARDIVIHAGQAFILDKQGLALVAAPLGHATIAVRKPDLDTPSIQFEPPTAGDLRFAAQL